MKSDASEYDAELAILNAIQAAASSDDAELIHFVIDPSVLGILSLTGRRSMTVNEIARSLKLPLATCYKLVEQMLQFGLVAWTGTTRTSSRGRAATYTSTLRCVTFMMCDGRAEATITWKNGQKDTFRREFFASEVGTENASRVTTVPTKT